MSDEILSVSGLISPPQFLHFCRPPTSLVRPSVIEAGDFGEGGNNDLEFALLRFFAQAEEAIKLLGVGQITSGFKITSVPAAFIFSCLSQGDLGQTVGHDLDRTPCLSQIAKPTSAGAPTFG